MSSSGGKKDEWAEVAGVDGDEGFSMGRADDGADADPGPRLLAFEMSNTSDVAGVSPSPGEEVIVGLVGSCVL